MRQFRARHPLIRPISPQAARDAAPEKGIPVSVFAAAPDDEGIFFSWLAPAGTLRDLRVSVGTVCPGLIGAKATFQVGAEDDISDVVEMTLVPGITRCPTTLEVPQDAIIEGRIASLIVDPGTSGKEAGDPIRNIHVGFTFSVSKVSPK